MVASMSDQRHLPLQKHNDFKETVEKFANC